MSRFPEEATMATTLSTSTIDPVLDVFERRWEEDILPTLTRYIEIPAKSPAFDPEWAAHGHIDRAVALIEDWSRRRPIEGLTVETVRLPGRTPLILLEVPGTSAETVLLYGHCDKQPEMVGWSDGLGPWIPVRRGERLYGRGGQDDGYAVFCALTAIEAVQRSGAPHARCVVLIEAGEESGSRDLPAYMEALAARLGEPDLVICLDSGCGNYDQLWGTTSLRGIVNPATEPWLLSALQAASERHFGKPAMFRGTGGAIPFMAMLGARFPRAQFFITGTGGPGCNAHGPNEFLHLPMAKRLTACVADVIVAHYRARRG
jgi:acetylornithine deacetylase/succinyl-diaminopimelate desuccinylase-like protein